ncbi:helix-turn-helix transcriptional regulator [Plantactinospora sp. KLBMP9567]|uniref:helix-turn-helix transcriptional regulator n=1 Tax=Plantactinospora sp. KLBMP9567 TaxID=3085900 RepID=UPI0029821CCD|nr:LuxR C-terminal-related transcriptional regulator [Plantactinospora sp. KLBMP9567]MDW5325909.1 LuxR C-terminal-related transcriptional regulator [Plantactinospora sp. KLBMP9567]
MATSFTLDRPGGSAADGLPVASAGQRWILRAVAICDDPCQIWFVERMTDRSGPGLHDDVEALIARGALADSPGGLRPGSVALRDAVRRGIPPSLLAALHNRAAGVLADEAHAAAAAEHLLRVLEVAGRVDVPLVSRVVADPAVDSSTAADLLLAARAGENPALGPELRRDWALAAVDHLMLAGRIEPALAILGDEIAADRAGAGYRALLLGRLGAWYATGRPSLAFDYLDRALAQPDLLPGHRSWLLTTLAAVAGRLGRPDVESLLAAADRAQADAPSPDGEIRLALARAGSALAGGDLPAARQVLGQVDPSAPAARAQAAILRAERIACQLACGEYDEAGTALRFAEVDLGSLGGAAQPMLAALDCRLRVVAGELPEASARAGLVLRRCPPGQLADEVHAELLAVRVEVAFRQGEPATARELLAGVEPPMDWPDAVAWVRLAGAAAFDPEPGRHAGLLRAAVDTLARSVRPLLLVPQQAPALTRAALLLGDPHRARQLADHLVRIAERVDSGLWWGVAQHVAGLVEQDPVLLRDAVAQLRTTSARPVLADALHDLAGTPGTGRAEARRAAEEAAALFGRLGATGDQERAVRRGRALVASDRRHRAGRHGAGFAALTAAETRVAELLAGGATKQQAAASLFVSFHTVDAQLRAVYAKLGVRNRLELARLWAARENPSRPAPAPSEPAGPAPAPSEPAGPVPAPGEPAGRD